MKFLLDMQEFHATGWMRRRVTVVVLAGGAVFWCSSEWEVAGVKRSE
jgi:hypothetical protein